MKFNLKNLLAVGIVMLVVLSSSRVLDDYSDQYTSDAIQNAAVTYATARGVNAIVSMMQSSTVEASLFTVVSGSLTIGELLDPLNDMVERFSTVMTWVLASLAAQKVLLLLASHSLFLYLVAVSGMVTLLLLYFGQAAVLRMSLRTFLLLVFVRFSLGLAVALNSGLDLLFMDRQLVENDQRVSQFQDQFFRVDQTSQIDTNSIRESTIEFWRSLSMSELNRKIGEGIESFINLLAIYLLKTILFPLGFFYAMYYGIRLLWRVDPIPEISRLKA
ncbi:MAG: hypothetical protein AAF353_16985 [Pseudomonadota bacterium]